MHTCRAVRARSSREMRSLLHRSQARPSRNRARRPSASRRPGATSCRSCTKSSSRSIAARGGADSVPADDPREELARRLHPRGSQVRQVSEPARVRIQRENPGRLWMGVSLEGDSPSSRLILLPSRRVPTKTGHLPGSPRLGRTCPIAGRDPADPADRSEASQPSLDDGVPREDGKRLALASSPDLLDEAQPVPSPGTPRAEAGDVPRQDVREESQHRELHGGSTRPPTAAARRGSRRGPARSAPGRRFQRAVGRKRIKPVKATY